MKQDHVAVILQQWKKQRPELDCSVVGVVGRISRAEKIMRPRIAEGFAEYGLSAIQFDIMATLRRNNVAMTPTQLYQSVMLSSGAMSANLDSLTQRGLIERQYSHEDRRSCSVILTEQGNAMMEKAIVSHIENENRMLQPLDAEEREQLASLLQRWLVENEG